MWLNYDPKKSSQAKHSDRGDMVISIASLSLSRSVQVKNEDEHDEAKLFHHLILQRTTS